MNRRRLPQLMFSLMLAVPLLSACGAPAAAPSPPTTTAIPPTPIPPTGTPAATPTDMPTSTRAPRPTYAPTYTPLPVAATTGPLSPGMPMLVDKFDDNSTGWTAAYDERVWVEGGKLHVASRKAGYVGEAFCAGACGPYGGVYYYQADLALNKSSDVYYGLTFGRTADGRSDYVFGIAPSSGEYALDKWDGKKWLTLIKWRTSDKIRRYPGVNTLGLQFSKGQINLYINGTMVDKYSDPDPNDPGRIGALVSDAGAELAVDNVAVYQTVPAAVAKPTLAPATAAPAACPNGAPRGTWALIINKVSPGDGTITIDGQVKTVHSGQNVFYLPVGRTSAIGFGGNTMNFSAPECGSNTLIIA